MSRAEQKWRYHAEKQREGGLSVREYCQHAGLCLTLFYTWAKRLRQGQASVTSAASSEPPLPSPTIVELPMTYKHSQATDVTADVLGVPIIVQLGKARVEVLPNFCKRTLRDVFEVLTSSSVA